MGDLTDRNVSDIFDRTIPKIRKGIYEVLKKQQAEGASLILEHKVFLETIGEKRE